MFIDQIEKEINEDCNKSITENGAVGYRTTGKELVDLNFSVSSLRNANESDIVSRFTKAYKEDRLIAVKWLMYARDIRGGLGERRLFRTIFKNIWTENPKISANLIKLVPEYGRWDDLWCLLDTPQKQNVIGFVISQLTSDLDNMKFGKPVSLLGKWMPSINTSSKNTRDLAKIFIDEIPRYIKGFNSIVYTKMLVELRKYIDVVEVKMSAKKWGDIKYESVPSRSNLIYNNAFLRNDEERRREFLSSLKKGETKINSGVLFPHDIVHKYMDGYCMQKYDETLELMWKSLPDFVNGNENTIVVADGSGSMTSRADSRSSVSCLEIANSLAIYFAEHSSGQFKDKYITFSERPLLVHLESAQSLREKIEIAIKHNEVANTNVEAVFDLILNVAIKNKMDQSELPANILIISDMEYDACKTNRGSDDKLFNMIAKRYKDAGYKLPKLAFWNLCSRTSTIPIKENANGVVLISGFSPSVVKMVFSNKTDPYSILLETLNSERYAPVEEAISMLV